MELGINSHPVTAAAAQAEPIDAREQLNDLNAKLRGSFISCERHRLARWFPRAVNCAAATR
jgi:hypothetical protein